MKILLADDDKNFGLVQGGRSFALFQTSTESRQMQEGDEIVGGVRLRQVRTDRIVVEQEGIGEEIRLGSAIGVAARGELAATDAMEGALEMRAQKFQALLDMESAEQVMAKLFEECEKSLKVLGQRKAGVSDTGECHTIKRRLP